MVNLKSLLSSKTDGNNDELMESTYLSSGCIAQHNGKVMAFGVGMDTTEDAKVIFIFQTLKWTFQLKMEGL